jgi:hypothetical protein
MTSAEGETDAWEMRALLYYCWSLRVMPPAFFGPLSRDARHPFGAHVIAGIS